MDETAYIGIGLPRVEQLPPGIIVKEDLDGTRNRPVDRADSLRVRPTLVRRRNGEDRACPRCAAMVLVEPID